MPSDQLDYYGKATLFKLRHGASRSQLAFETLGYADAALASFEVFKDLQRSGVVPSETKFQVNLPTPLGITAAFFDPPDSSDRRAGNRSGLGGRSLSDCE
jgi:hypothetical protein